MSINEIAKKILHLRETKMTGFIMAGVLREELGFEGYGEALRRRWIMADMEQSGMVTISNNLGVIEDIRQLAAECKSKCGTCNKSKCDCEGRCDSCKGEKCTCESQGVGEDKQVWKHGQYWDKSTVDGMKAADDDENVNPDSGLSHSPDCDCGKCPKSKKKSSMSETAHFFAQAHAFRRSALVGENDGMGAPAATAGGWDSFEPEIRQHFLTDPRLVAAARNAGMTPDQFFNARLADLRAHFEQHTGLNGAYTRPEQTEQPPPSLPDYSDTDHDEFYTSRQPHFRKHFDSHKANAGLGQPERDKRWGEYEPSLKNYLRNSPTGRQAHHTWRTTGKDGMVKDPQRGNIQAPQPEIGVNDSLIVNNARVIHEASTLGLGRTGNAPNVPVPGLGAQSAQAPTPAAPASPASPAAQRPGEPGQMAMNIVQAEAVAQSKYGKQFAQLSREQQFQIERELKAMKPAAQ